MNRLSERGRRAGFSVGCATVFCAWLLCPHLTAEPQARGQPAFTATSDLVLIPLHVTDRAGKTITDLRRDQFEVFEEKQRREIVSFYKEDGPVSLGFIVDLSGSMRHRLPRAMEALHAIVAETAPADEMFLITCSTQPHLAVDFTDDESQITSNLSFARADGTTALVDSIYMALQHVRHGRHKRRALIVISDGMDNHSRHSFSGLMSAAIEADTQIYTVALPGRVTRHGNPEILEQLSRATGGLHLDTAHERELPAAAAQVSVALRNVYVIGFRPQGSASGKWQRVQVSLVPEFRRSLRICARSGFALPE